MGTEMSISERAIMNLRDKVHALEQERRKAYISRLSEIVVETATWNLPPGEYPMELAKRAFKLGIEFGSNMHEYL